MELAFRVILFLTGIVNFTPSLIAYFPSKIIDYYGIDIAEPNSELLLRHRAMLFGIIGGFMIFSSLTKKYYVPSTVIGIISMLSYVVLFFLISGSINAELTKVLKIDMVSLVLLVIAFISYSLSK